MAKIVFLLTVKSSSAVLTALEWFFEKKIIKQKMDNSKSFYSKSGVRFLIRSTVRDLRNFDLNPPIRSRSRSRYWLGIGILFSRSGSSIRMGIVSSSIPRGLTNSQKMWPGSLPDLVTLSIEWPDSTQMWPGKLNLTLVTLLIEWLINQLHLVTLSIEWPDSPRMWPLIWSLLSI